MVSHLDHSEHSVKIMITEHGIADLRGKSPIQRAHEIIENCVAPEYRETLRDYLKLTSGVQTPQDLSLCFAMHRQFAETGSMLNVKWK
jgi:acyl-CoA hydrolase